MLIFLHIDKTAGTTFTNILKKAYAGKCICDFHDIDRQYQKYYGSLFPNDIINEQELRLLYYNALSTYKIDLLIGHFEFGVDKSYGIKNFAYVTFLRNPIERVISHYYYLYTSDRPKHKRLIASYSNIEEFIENSIFANNLQAKMILGDTYNYYYNKMVNGYDIKQELLHILINKKIVIGLSEEFDLSILYFKYHFKWKTRGVLDYKTQNKTPYRPHVNSLNNNIIQKIENRNKLDILLYESGKIIFDKQIKKFPLWKRKFLKISDKYLFLNHIIDFFQKYF